MASAPPPAPMPSPRRRSPTASCTGSELYWLDGQQKTDDRHLIATGSGSSRANMGEHGDSPEQRGSWTYRKGTGTPLLWQAAVDVGLVHRVFGRLLCSFNVEAAVQQARRGADAVTSAPLTNRELYWVGAVLARRSTKDR